MLSPVCSGWIELVCSGELLLRHVVVYCCGVKKSKGTAASFLWGDDTRPLQGQHSGSWGEGMRQLFAAGACVMVVGCPGAYLCMT